MELAYTVRKGRDVVEVGRGRTINISRRGVRFKCDCAVPEGVPIEVALVWPVPLSAKAGLQLKLTGKTVRAQDQEAAMEFTRYAFEQSRWRGGRCRRRVPRHPFVWS